MTMNETAIEGRVIRPGEDDYDEQRLAWQRRFDPRPALIVEAAGPEDVQTAIRYAREADLPLAVQGTGHGTVVAADDALLLKTGTLSSVDVDPRNATARVGAGALWADVIAAAPDGLAPLSGTSATVAVGGYTIGGGAGWLSRAYGFAADSLLSAEVITAEGERLTASAEENPDLFWALRGGGGNFGVVTELEFRLHPAERLYGGMVMFDAEHAHATLARYREWAQTEPDESNTAVVVMNMPAIPQVPEPVRGKRVLAVRAIYLGDADAGARVLAPLLEAAGTPLMGAHAGDALRGHRDAAGPGSAAVGRRDAVHAARRRRRRGARRGRRSRPGRDRDRVAALGRGDGEPARRRRSDRSPRRAVLGGGQRARARAGAAPGGAHGGRRRHAAAAALLDGRVVPELPRRPRAHRDGLHRRRLHAARGAQGGLRPGQRLQPRARHPARRGRRRDR